MKKNETILKKYLSAIKGKTVWAGNEGDYLYVTDRASILKIATYTLPPTLLAEAQTATAGALLQRTSGREDWKKSESHTVDELEKFLKAAREENNLTAIDTSFRKDAEKDILRVYSFDAGNGPLPWVIKDRYAKILDYCGVSAFVKDRFSGGYCFSYSQKFEFFVLPVNTAPSFFDNIKAFF